MKTTNLKIQVETNICGGISLALIDVKTGKVWANLDLSHTPTSESILQSISLMEKLKNQIVKNN